MLPQQQEGAITDVFPNVEEEEEEEGRVEHLSRSHSVMEDSMALIQLEDSMDNLTGKRGMFMLSLICYD